MSRSDRAPAHLTAPRQLPLSQVVDRLATRMAEMFVATVLRHAERMARRELAGLDDRCLGNMGFARADLMSLLDAVAELRSAVALSRSTSTCRRLGA